MVSARRSRLPNCSASWDIVSGHSNVEVDRGERERKSFRKKILFFHYALPPVLGSCRRPPCPLEPSCRLANFTAYQETGNGTIHFPIANSCPAVCRHWTGLDHLDPGWIGIALALRNPQTRRRLTSRGSQLGLGPPCSLTIAPAIANFSLRMVPSSSIPSVLDPVKLKCMPVEEAGWSCRRHCLPRVIKATTPVQIEGQPRIAQFGSRR